nr:MAG TPA: Flagellar and Swarming motility protein [Caudoviricetes sp.]
MKNIILTQIVKTKPEEVTKPLEVNPDDISIRSKNGKTYVTKHHPIERRYIVKETEEEIKDIIENAYAEYKEESQPPHYDFNRDLSIMIKITDTKAVEIAYKSDEYDSFYYNNRFLVIIKDNVVIREISIGKIIDISYIKNDEE